MLHRVGPLLISEPAPLFAIVDGAQDRSLSRALRALKLEHRTLYDGEAGEELAPFGPYLVALPKETGELTAWVARGWGKSVGVYLTSLGSFDAIRRHLRRFLMVELDDHRTVYFRYYDPRVLRTFLPTCTHEEWVQFFGPIESYFAESEDGRALLRFRRDADDPAPESTVLEF